MIILCYRAEEAIIPFVKRIHELFSWLNIEYELILVGNYWENSGDKTPQIVKELSQSLPRTRCVTEVKKGYMGWDMKSGIKAATGDFVGLIDGDGQFPIDAILPALYHALVNKVDVAKTYRVVRGDGLYRALISSTYNTVFKFLFGTSFRDVNSKPKIVKRSVLNEMNLVSDDWFIDAEIMIKAQKMNLKVYEFPIRFVENENRASFVKFGAIWEFIINLYKFRFSK